MISIIVPVYNVEKYIGECVASLTAQTCRDLEILLVVDGATDSSGALCDQLAKSDDRIRVFHKENGGASSARNMGIAHAKGDYLMFVDADDWLEKHALETMLAKLQAENTDACFCKNYFKDHTVTATAVPADATSPLKAEEAVKFHLKGAFIASACLSLARTEKVRDCRFDLRLGMLEDWEYNFQQLLCLDSVSLLDEPFYHYRTVIGSASTSAMNDQKLSSLLIPDKVEKQVAEQGLPYQAEAPYVRVYILYHLLVILAGGTYQCKAAAKIAAHARRALPFALRTGWVPLRQKAYMLAASISPRIFCRAYALKYRRQSHGR